MYEPNWRSALVATVLIASLVGFVALSVLLPDHAGWTHEQFAVSFWSNFWSDLIVAVPIAFGFAWLMGWRKHGSARIYYVSRPTGTDGKIALDFYIKNTGQIAFRSEEIYWVVFIDGPGSPPGLLSNRRHHYNTRLFADFERELRFRGEPLYLFTYRGILDAPLFHGRRLRLFTGNIEPGTLSQYRFWYYVSTTHGVLPEGVEVSDDGPFPVDNLPRITELRLPDSQAPV